MQDLTRQYKLTTRFWLFAMILSMLFVQGLQIHVHTYTHKAETLGHLHYDKAHSVFDFTQQHHSDEVAQLNQAHSGLLGKVSFTPMLAIILVTLLLIACQRSGIRLERYFPESVLCNKCDKQFRPPLRAPPAH